MSRWQAPADLLHDRRVMSRSLAGVWVAGTTLLLLSIAVPDASIAGEPELLTTALVSYAVAGFALVAGERLPAWSYDALVSLALVLVGALVYSSDADGPYALFYLWPTVWAFHFLPFTRAAVQLAVAVCTMAVALLAQSGVDDFAVARFLVVTGTLTIVAGLVGMLTLRLQRLLEHVSELARTDTLTGVANRRGFDEAMTAELSRAERSGRPVSLVMLDIDHFKALNDRHGHGAGDEVLREIGALLRRCARPTDIAARVGGEEFAVLLSDTAAPEALRFAERLRAMIHTTVAVEGRPVSVSLGVAAGPPLGRDALVRAADEALYGAKRAGRNRTTLAGSGADPARAALR